MWLPWRKHKIGNPAETGEQKRKNGAKRLGPELTFFAERGPFDIIGDVHGCLEELLKLMSELGYRVERRPSDFAVAPPDGRKLAFVGDLVNRGPATPDVLRLVMGMVRAGQAFCVAGNQDMKLARLLSGRDRKLTIGIERSLGQLECEPARFRDEVAEFLHALSPHYVLDQGRLIVAHAGLKEKMHGSSSPRARKFAIFGENTGKTDEYGLPVRYNWAADYRGKALVVYGHTPVPEPVWINNTVNLDTGCVYGGYLSALRHPEEETLSVPAKVIYYPSRKRFLPNQVLAANGKTLVG